MPYRVPLPEEDRYFDFVPMVKILNSEIERSESDFFRSSEKPEYVWEKKCHHCQGKTIHFSPKF